MNPQTVDKFIDFLGEMDMKLAESTNEHVKEGNLCAHCWVAGAMQEDEQTKMLYDLTRAVKESPDTARFILIREMAEYESQRAMYSSLLDHLDELFPREEPADN